MSLIDEIRIAQRNAGEAAVVANLERMGLVDKPNQATPHGTLLEQIMDPCQPKNEREWAALSEIESLRAELAALQAEPAMQQVNLTTKREKVILLTHVAQENESLRAQLATQALRLEDANGLLRYVADQRDAALKNLKTAEPILSTEQSTALNMMLAHYGSDPRVQCLRELKVAAEPVPMTDAPVEVGWLIECRVDPTAPYWLTADNTNTNDANEALRFARKIDADGFLKVFLTAHFGDDTFGIYKRHFSPEKYSVTEHMFIDIKPKGE